MEQTQSPQPHAVLPRTPARKTSGLAIASLVCGILGFCTAGLSALVGLILGIVSAVKIGRSQGHLGGTGLAIAGIVVSAVALVFGLILAAFTGVYLMAVPKAYRAEAHSSMRQANLRMLALGAQQYAVEQKDSFPPAETWAEALAPDVGGNLDRLVINPLDPSAGRIVAMNARLGGARTSSMAEPGRTVLFFECRPGSPPAGGPELLAPEPISSAGYLIAFADGHVEAVRPEAMAALLWAPTGP